ncbi:MAG: hypothetical protein [Microviridae sp.]|nr:MAG: hypothetical protein [Microviridae sp.]
MFKYFNVEPDYSSCFSSSSAPHPLTAYVNGPFREFRSHGSIVRSSLLEDKPVEAGTLIIPSYDSEEVISSGNVNMFNSPNMSELDKFEYAREQGMSVLEARQIADASVQNSTSTPVPEPTSSAE